MPRLTYATRSGAGATAMARFERGMRSWRAVIVRRARWAFVLVGGAPIAIVIGRSNHHLLDWTLGLTTAVVKRVWGLAVELKLELDAGGVHVRWVRAVVVIWSEFPQQLAEGDRITFVHGERLAQWLTQQQAVRAFDPERAEQVLASREAT